MSRGKVRVLLVDDEPGYVWAIKTNLEARGYEVLSAPDGETAVRLAISMEPDMIILDVNMPGMDGYEVYRRVREFSAVPIILLTSLTEDVDQIKALGMGADGCLTKPFTIPELLARLRAVWQRVQVPGIKEPDSMFQSGELVVDFARQRVFARGQEVALLPIEYRLLCELVRCAGQVLGPDCLLQKVWGIGYEGKNHLVRNNIYRLRRKIESDPRNPQYIQTRPGMGYFFGG